MIYKTMLFFLRAIPIAVLHGLIKSIFQITKYRKQVIINNFKNSSISQNYRKSDKAFYQENIDYLSRTLSESIHLCHSKTKENIRYKGIKHLEKKCKNEGSVILLASHYGNWELACVHLPRFTSIPCYGIYKPLKNKAIDHLVKQERSTYGLQLVPIKKVARIMTEHRIKKKQAIFILISDQNPNSKNSIIWADFLGIKTAFNNGSLKLHQQHLYGMAHLKITPHKGLFNYTVEIEDNIDTSENGIHIIPSYIRALTSQLKDNPIQWLWSHKRWKRSQIPPRR